MIDFTPGRLIEVKDKVKKNHPTPVSDYDDPTRNDPVKGELREKLKSVEAKHIQNFVNNLRTLERRILPNFLLDESEEIRDKTLKCIELRPNLLEASQLLWQAFTEDYLNEDFAKRIVKVFEDFNGYSKLSKNQQLILSKRKESVSAGAEAFWNAVEKDVEDPVEMLQNVPGNSSLSHYLKRYFLTEARRSHWNRLSLETFKEYYRNLKFDFRPDVFIHSFELFRNIPVQDLDHRPKLEFLERQFRKDSSIQPKLDKRKSKVLDWYERLKSVFELREFFQDNERFRFWAEYIQQMEEAPLVDKKNKRLFMDFGRIGVIEFGNVNNAAYVYPSDVYEELKRKNLKEDSSHPHSAFKDKIKMKMKLSHHSNWQKKFRNRMQTYGLNL